ncbi:hypothetical protein H9P43_009634 [Blastocladiella emersonii ATCC 22665]|nr:hypothetical protein H9P43_009634 [Blastocladiella emersonii ATCC 22665]
MVPRPWIFNTQAGTSTCVCTTKSIFKPMHKNSKSPSSSTARDLAGEAAHAVSDKITTRVSVAAANGQEPADDASVIIITPAKASTIARGKSPRSHRCLFTDSARFYLKLLLIKHERSPHGYSLDHLTITRSADAPPLASPWQFAFTSILSAFPEALKEVFMDVDLDGKFTSYFSTDDALSARLAAEAVYPRNYTWTMRTRALLAEVMIPFDAKWVYRDLLELTSASPLWKKQLVPDCPWQLDWSDDENESSDVFNGNEYEFDPPSVSIAVEGDLSSSDIDDDEIGLDSYGSSVDGSWGSDL